VVAGYSWLAYRQLEVALVDAGTGRAAAASQRIVAILDESARPFRRDGRRLTSDSSIVHFLAAGISRAAAQRTLDSTRTKAALTESVSLWSRDVKPLLVSGAAIDARADILRAARLDVDTTSPAIIGPLAFTADTGHYSMVVAVRSARGDTLGFVVVHRRIASGAAAHMITQLIGSDAQFLIGNADGVLWTNLETRVAGPPDPLRSHDYTAPNGVRWVGAAVPVPRTPWLVWIQLPRDVVLAPAESFLADCARVALLVIVAGTIGAWLVSRHITKPIAAVAGAAAGISSGDYASRVVVRRDDEVGRLATSFNRMAEQVEGVTTELETQAADLEASNTELRESEERFRRLIEFSPDGIVVHREGRFVYANAAAAALFGAVSPDELLGRVVLDVVHADDRALVEARIRQNVELGHATPVAGIRLFRIDGSIVSVEAMSMPLVFDGCESVQTILRDVTERKRLEEQFRQSQKMEAVGRLAGGVAHDFNNLLTVISSYTTFLIESLPLNDPRREDATEIKLAANRAAQLTGQLLALSRKQMLQPRPMLLNDVVQETEKMLRRLIGEDIVLETALAADLSEVNADRGQIEQVLMNLAVNARDAMPDGGRLTLQTADVDLSDDYVAGHLGVAPGPYVMLAVSDSGCGMDASVRERMFEPFFTTKEAGKGTGLGLSTVYGIVKQSGGDVWVYSEPGEGTTFKIYLPRLAAGAAPARVSFDVRAAPANGHETVLLVEDDERLRTLAARVLGERGYTVLPASNGADALAVAEGHPGVIDLVVSDVVMPGMTGRILAERLTTLRPSVKALFMSGYTDDDVMRRGILDRSTAFLQKPFTPDQLAQKVREVLEASSRCLPPAFNLA
jgi:PAS domain S-box-containing protein